MSIVKRIYLVGYMGSGKTAIGKRVSFGTKLPFYDMDAEIVRKAGMTIPEIFEQYGEAFFRQLETEFLKEFRDEFCIISTGGGVAMREENRQIMRNTGLVFYLNAPFKDIWRRISTDKNRPIVQRSTRAELEQLYNQRAPQYLAASHIRVETENRSLRDITSYIIFQINRLRGE